MKKADPPLDNFRDKLSNDTVSASDTVLPPLKRHSSQHTPEFLTIGSHGLTKVSSLFGHQRTYIPLEKYLRALRLGLFRHPPAPAARFCLRAATQLA